MMNNSKPLFHFFTISLFTLAVLCTTSCGVYKKYESDFRLPEKSVPTWKEVFTDPCLQVLIDSTLKNNSSMKTVQLNIKEAEIAYKTSRLGYLPTFAFAPTGEATKLGKNPTQWQYSLGISAQWQLDIFGASVTNTKRQKAAQLEYQRDYQQALECQLISSVAQLYYQLLEQKQQLEIQQGMRVLYEKTYESTQSLFQAGQYTIAAVDEAKAQLENLISSIIQLEYNITQTQYAICKLMDEAPHTIKCGSLDNTSIPNIVKTGISTEMLNNRPDVRSAEKQMEIAYYGMQLSKGALYPSITLKANGGWMNPTSWFIDGIGSLVQPIFQGGKLRADLKISKLEQQVALVNFRKTVLDATHELTTAMDDIKLAADQKDHLHAQVEALMGSVDANQELMNNGSATYLEVLTAVKGLLTARTAEVSNQANAAQALVSLYGALGGR